MHPGGKKHRLGASLSLDKWASAKVSKYDKRKVIEKQKQLKAKQVNKYKKLKKRLEAEGKLAGSLPKVGSSMLLVGTHSLLRLSTAVARGDWMARAACNQRGALAVSSQRI